MDALDLLSAACATATAIWNEDWLFESADDDSFAGDELATSERTWLISGYRARCLSIER